MKAESKKYLLLLFLLISYSFSANFPFPQSVNYPYGIKPNNVSQDTMNNVVLTAFNNWKNAYLTQSGCPQPNMWRVKRPEGDQNGNYKNGTVSEGIGYGMLITVLMTDSNDNTKQYFDGLFRYYKHYTNSKNLMHWHVDANGNIVGYNAATDADEDVALALLFAHKQWGSSGAINYLQEAHTIINALMTHCVESGTYVLKPGDVWGGSNVTNPSYFAPGFYKVFAAATGNANWNNVVNKCYDITGYFYNNYTTALVPDWCQASGAQASGYSYDYKYDACRFPWRYGIDYLWYGNSYVYNHLKKLSNWISSATGGTPSNIKDGYQLNGNVIGQYNNASFVGPFAIAAMCDSSFQTWLNNLYTRLASFSQENYYNDSLRLLTLLVVTGNFPNLWNLSDTLNLYIVNPSSGSIIEGSTTVVVNVYTAGTVSSVEFYVDNVLKYTDTSSPYSWVWDTTQYTDGVHELKVVGYTTSGSSDTKKVWIIINNIKQPPAIQSISLQDGSTVQGTVNISVNATDDVGITKVEFYINNVNIYTKTSAPFSYSWNTQSYSDGEYSLKIKVYDTDNLSTEQQLKVYVDNIDSKPTVRFISLQNGTTLQATVNIQIEASDDRGISRIELYIDNTLLFTQNNSTRLNYSLDTSLYSDGLHVLKSVAYDTQNQTSQVEISVYFDNIDNPPACRILFYENQLISGTVLIPLVYSDDKGISKIEYYINNVCVSTKTSHPFDYFLNTTLLQDTLYSLKVIVYDTIQQSTFSVVNVIVDNTAPQLNLELPSNLSYVSKITTISFSASDNYLLSKFEIYVNSNLLLTKTLQQTSTYFVYLWDTQQFSSTTAIKVAVYDKINNSISKQVSVYVDNQPPAITSINLYNEQVLSGTIKIDILATDNFSIEKIDFYINHSLIQTLNQTPYSLLWQTNSYPDGRHLLEFVVYDRVNNFSKTSLEVIVNNSGDKPPEGAIIVSSTHNIISKTTAIKLQAKDDNLLKSLWLYHNNIFISSFNITSSSFSYEYLLDTTKFNDGNFQISIKIYDSLTQSTSIVKNLIIDNTPPVINFITPTNNSVVSNICSFQIEAYDSILLAFLEFRMLNSNNEELLKISTHTGYLTFTLNTKQYLNGTYFINVKACDIVNNLSEKSITIYIANEDEKPQIILTNITDKMKVSEILKAEVLFSDDYGIAKIEFYIDNQLVDTYTVSSSSGSYVFSFNTQFLTDGYHELKIISYDTSYQTAVSVVEFFVDNIKDKMILTLDENNINNVIDFGEYIEELKIYNTNGELIYHTLHQNKWDGKTINGDYVKSGLYLYSVKKLNSDKFNYGVVYILK
ncbi:MAG: glycosyl hydrolase family 8 [Endomicrobiia bacterium]